MTDLARPTIPVRHRGAAEPLTGVFLHFTDGLTVNVLDCPRNTHARSHWHDDSSGCKCPPGTEALKVRAR